MMTMIDLPKHKCPPEIAFWCLSSSRARVRPLAFAAHNHIYLIFNDNQQPIVSISVREPTFFENMFMCLWIRLCVCVVDVGKNYYLFSVMNACKPLFVTQKMFKKSNKKEKNMCVGEMHMPKGIWFSIRTVRVCGTDHTNETLTNSDAKQQFHFKHRLSDIFDVTRALIIRLHIFGGAYFKLPGDRLTHPHTHARNGFHLDIFDFWILTGMPNTSHRAHDLLSLNKYLWRLHLPMCASACD